MSKAKIGTALEAAESNPIVREKLFAPIPIKLPLVGEGSVNIELAKDNNGNTIPALIVYDIRAKRSSDDEQEEASESMWERMAWESAKDMAAGSVALSYRQMAANVVARGATTAEEAAPLSTAEVSGAAAAGEGGFWSTLGKALDRVAGPFMIVPGFVFKQEERPTN